MAAPPATPRSTRPGDGPHGHPHLDPADRRLGLRLLAAAVAAVLAAIPFAFLTLLVEAAWPPLRRVDAGTAERLHEQVRAHPAWVDALNTWTNVFGPWTFRVLVVLVAAWLGFRHAPRLAAWALTTLVAGGVLGFVLKAAVGRSRPHLPDPVSHAPGASFPSGHALTATLGCGVVLLALLPLLTATWAKVAAWLAAATVVLVTAYTRIALGVHWVSDVLGGIVLGAGVVAATSVAFATWRTRDIGRAPVSPGRDGLEPEAAEEIAFTHPTHSPGSRL